jgi:hypothetical protein
VALSPEPLTTLGPIGRLPVASKSQPAVLQCENACHASDHRHRQMTAKGKANQSDMRSDQHQHHEYGDPCAPVNSMSLHWSHHSHRPHEVETADAHGSALDAAQFRFLEPRHNILRVDVTMAVKMREEA